jgi:hypothetical protein
MPPKFTMSKLRSKMSEFYCRIRAWISKWFIRKPVDGDRKTTQELVALCVDIVLALFVGATALSVVWKWSLWFICFACAVVIFCLSKWIRPLPLKTKVVIVATLFVVCFSIFKPTVKKQWREEKASQETGVLIPPQGNTPDNYLLVKIGDSNVIFASVLPDPKRQPFIL